ncbi:DeoR/GlpR transcriptional regulator [Paenibacillaceae bacterium]|nr:DeoR/GlpR transcriptional regulator [Paenibacillaceae bacterium]
MEKTMSKGDQRRAAIVEQMKARGEVTIQEVMEQYGCSEATARRDLNLLALSGGIIRTIGGAYYEGAGSTYESSFNEKKHLLLPEKKSIAQLAASLVREGDVIGLTGGTTTYLIARELKAFRNITVVTNAVNIAMELAESEDIQTVLTGGVMRSKSYELCGPLAESIIEKLNIGKMFTGIDGISSTHGLTTYSELEARIGQLMIARARQVIAVFDHTKLGVSSLFTMAPLSAVHACITDRSVDAEYEREFDRLGMEMHYAEQEVSKAPNKGSGNTPSENGGGQP